MLKLIGGLLVISAGQLIGSGMADRLRRRAVELRWLQTALLFLQTEISYTATPLPEALERVSRLVEFPARALLGYTSMRLLQGSGVTAQEAWEESLQRFERWSALKDGDLSILRSLGGALGVSSREEQEKHLLLAREQLRQGEQAAENERARFESMYRYSGLLAGLLLVIVLL